MNYSELQCTSNFSFLRGASHPEEMIVQAAAFGYTAIGITDRNSLAGIVRAHASAKKTETRFLPGCRLDLVDGPSLLAYPTNQDGYSQLSGLLTIGNLRAEKGECHLYKEDAYSQLKDLKLIVIPPNKLNADFELDPQFEKHLKSYREVFDKRLYMAMSRRYMGDDVKHMFRLSQLSSRLHIPLVATNDVHYHIPDRRQLQDVLTCIREKRIIQNAGFLLHQNAERFLKPEEEMERLFRLYPQAIRATQEITEACHFNLSQLKYEYPEEITTEGRTPQEELAMLAWKGAHAIFGDEIPKKTSDAILYELKFIREMNYAAYFLTVYDIVRFAREAEYSLPGPGVSCQFHHLLLPGNYIDRSYQIRFVV